MAWAALGKSLLKSGVKKVATKKLLNRKKKPKVGKVKVEKLIGCLLYTSDAADE